MPVHWGFSPWKIVSLSSPIGAKLLHAVGVAYASKFRGEKVDRAGVVRRGSDFPGRVPLGDELRGSLQDAGGLLLREQPVRHLAPGQAPDGVREHRDKGRGLRLRGSPDRRERHTRGLQGDEVGGRQGPLRRGTYPHRGRHLQDGRALHVGRPDHLQERGRGRALEEEGPHSEVHGLSDEEGRDQRAGEQEVHRADRRRDVEGGQGEGGNTSARRLDALHRRLLRDALALARGGRGVHEGGGQTAPARERATRRKSGRMF